MYTSNIIFEGGIRVWIQDQPRGSITVDFVFINHHHHLKTPTPPVSRFLPLLSPKGCGSVLNIPPVHPSPLLRDVGRGVNRVPLPRPSPLFRDVVRFRSCSEGSGDGGGGTWGTYMVCHNSLTPDTDATNLTQTKTPTTVHLIPTTRA